MENGTSLVDGYPALPDSINCTLMKGAHSKMSTTLYPPLLEESGSNRDHDDRTVDYQSPPRRVCCGLGRDGGLLSSN